MLKDGVLVQFRDEKGDLIKRRLKVFDFEHPEENHFLAVRELWVKGALYRRRTDVLGFVNGIPMKPTEPSMARLQSTCAKRCHQQAI